MELKLGAIDIGSNAIRCLIKSVTFDGENTSYKKLTLVRVPIRLGEDVFTDGKIGRNKKERLVNAMIAYAHLFKAYEVDTFRACATSAMREAENGNDVIKEVKKKAGIEIEVISGMEEARILFDAGISQYLDQQKAYLYVDVGGGSTELTLFSDGQAVISDSFKIGTVRALQKTVQESAEEWERMRLWIEENVSSYQLEYLIGSGGNINKLVKMTPGANKETKFIDKAQLKTLFADLSELTYEERMTQYGLNYDRADVIIPAAKIFLTVIRWTGTETVFAPKFGLSDGMIHDLSTLSINIEE